MSGLRWFWHGDPTYGVISYQTMTTVLNVQNRKETIDEIRGGGCPSCCCSFQILSCLSLYYMISSCHAMDYSTPFPTIQTRSYSSALIVAPQATRSIIQAINPSLHDPSSFPNASSPHHPLQCVYPMSPNVHRIRNIQNISTRLTMSARPDESRKHNSQC